VLPAKVYETTENMRLKEYMSSRHYVFQTGETSEEFDVLEDTGNTHLGSFVGGYIINSSPVEENVTSLGTVKAADAVEEGSFTGTVRADNRQNFPLPRLKAHAIYRLDATEGEMDVIHLQHGVVASAFFHLVSRAAILGG